MSAAPEQVIARRPGVVIAVDPHKASWTAVVVTSDLAAAAAIRVEVNRAGYRQLRRFAAAWPDARWAIEGAVGLGAPLAERLGEDQIAVNRAPSEVPVELRSMTRPIRDAAGRLVDWALTRRAGSAPPAVPQFETFREAFAVDIPVGERAFLTTLISQADPIGDGTDALRRLLLPTASFDAATAGLLPGLLDDLQHRCTSRSAAGWGVVRTSDTQLVRRLIPTDPPTTLLATPTAALAIGQDGLHLLLRHRTVKAWHQTPEGMMLVTPTAIVRIGRASLSAALLRTLARGADDAAVRPVPLAALAMPMMRALRAAADLAVRTGGAIELRSPGWKAQSVAGALGPVARDTSLRS
jgi:hypothetical protein